MTLGHATKDKNKPVVAVVHAKKGLKHLRKTTQQTLSDTKTNEKTSASHNY
eukprot:CAMPEP_0182892572 /NCGR_PEP_ID=MMETSP0034_2-20130328/23955_1 /TAXON_ID=156128 /ORGANISM="Nephroselmis pyriformis, Strain CCMP717" /LENGTH=50 /DNA_ID=CAMNT_0025026259 /DNA_START=89 /DNA_END=241 /DNA_ORIENTATION=+